MGVYILRILFTAFKVINEDTVNTRHPRLGVYTQCLTTLYRDLTAIYGHWCRLYAA